MSVVLNIDPINKRVNLVNGVSFNMLGIYSEVMDWCKSIIGIAFETPIRAVGKIELRPGVFTDIIYVLMDGWKLGLYPGTYQVTITGTTVTDDGTLRTYQDPSSQIEVTFDVATSAVIISQPPEAMLDEAIVDHQTVGSVGEATAKAEKYSKLAFVK